MDTINNLRILDIKPDSNTRAIVIWLHGLGASANDFEPVLPIINEITPGIRYIFPNAPVMSVSINGGMTMPAWYDVSHPDLSQQADLPGIYASCEKLSGLVEHIRNEVGEDIPVILAGFSQGGVIALTTALTTMRTTTLPDATAEPCNIQGVLALSAYLPEINALKQKDKLDLSLLMMHGSNDPIVPIEHARHSFDKLSQLISNTRWQEYPMDHTLCYEEVQQIGEWLKTLIAKK